MPNAFSSFPASLFIFFFPTLLLILFIPSPSLSLQVCPTYFCPRDSADVINIQEIRFPFSLSGVIQSSQRCGYPRFTIACSGRDQPTINLGSSKNFTVTSIDYKSQSIWVSDSDGCLPNRVLSLDLSSTPFYGVDYQNYTFLNCSAEEDLKLSRFRGRAALAVPCMSGVNFTVYVTSKSSMVEFLLGSYYRCRKIRSVWSPVWWPIYRGDNGGPDPDTAALLLGWKEPECGECESRGGVCGFENDGKIGCSVSAEGVPKLVKYGLAIGLGVPIFLIMIGLTFYMSGRIRNSHQRNQQGGDGSGLTEFSLSIFPHPQPSIPMVGLDDPTIESYPKTLLGESKRLPNPSDGLCAICLSEYQAKESLRTIPECNHYFHAQCIDEWLKMQGTCPLCRNSPAKK